MTLDKTIWCETATKVAVLTQDKREQQSCTRPGGLTDNVSGIGCQKSILLIAEDIFRDVQKRTYGMVRIANE